MKIKMTAALLTSLSTLLMSLPVGAQQAGGGAGAAPSERSSGGAGAFLLSANASIFQTKSETEATVNTDSSYNMLDGNLGYMTSSGLYIGGVYGSKGSDVLAAVTKPKETRSGASLGFMARGWVLHVHYFFEAEIKNHALLTDKIDGTGTQVDLGYLMRAVGPLFVGGQISARKMEYKKVRVNGVESLNKHTTTDVYPSIRLTLLF